MREDVLPIEFASIANKVTCVRRKSANEFSSSCVNCGGSVHKNGDPSDRFVMFRVGRGGFPLGFCRKCGYRWYPAKEQKPSKEEMDEWRKNQIEIEKSRIEAAKRSIELLQADKMWEIFYSQNNGYSVDVFRSWGIADSWIDYLKLGLIPDYTVYRHNEEAYHSPAFAIPVWNVGGIVQNIKLRIANPKEDTDRYRNFYAMGNSYLFIPLYDIPLTGAGLIVEGEKKAIVMEQTLDDMGIRVIGVQTKTPAPELFEQLKDLDPIYIWLDPDAMKKDKKAPETAVERMVRYVGKERARIVDCPVKCDDGIVLQGLNPKQFLRMAKKA